MGTPNQLISQETNSVCLSTIALPPIGPLTPEKKTQQIHHFSFHPSHTPKHSVFDAFAPAPATKSMPAKYMQDSGASVVRRRLNLNLITDMIHESTINTTPEEEEEDLFESLYIIILDSIVSEHTKERVPIQVSDSGGFRTPKFRPLLNGVAETCPGAPLKSKSQYRNIHMELCRKLQF